MAMREQLDAAYNSASKIENEDKRWEYYLKIDAKSPGYVQGRRNEQFKTAYDSASKIKDQKIKENYFKKISDKQSADEQKFTARKQRADEKASIKASAPTLSKAIESPLIRGVRGAAEGAQSTLYGIGAMGAGLIGREGTARELRRKQEGAKARGEALETAGRFGFGAEQVGEFFVPGEAATKIGKAPKLVGAASKVQKALKLKSTSFLGRRVGGLIREGVPLVVGESLLGKAQDPDTTFTKEALFSAGFLALLPPSVQKTISKEKGIAQEFLERGRETLDETGGFLKKTEAPKIKGKLQPDITDFKQTSIPSTQSKVPLAGRGISIADEAIGAKITPKSSILKGQGTIKRRYGLDVTSKEIRDTLESDMRQISKLSKSELGLLEELSARRRKILDAPKTSILSDSGTSEINRLIRGITQIEATVKVHPNKDVAIDEALSYLAARGGGDIKDVHPMDFLKKHFTKDNISNQEFVQTFYGDELGEIAKKVLNNEGVSVGEKKLLEDVQSFISKDGDEILSQSAKAGDFIAPPKETPTGSLGEIPETIIDQKIPDKIVPPATKEVVDGGVDELEALIKKKRNFGLEEAESMRMDELTSGTKTLADKKPATIRLNDRAKKTAGVGAEVSGQGAKNLEKNLLKKSPNLFTSIRETYDTFAHSAIDSVNSFVNPKTGESLRNIMHKGNNTKSRVLQKIRNADMELLDKIPKDIQNRAALLRIEGVTSDKVSDPAVKKMLEIFERAGELRLSVVNTTKNPMLKADGSDFVRKENWIPPRTKKYNELPEDELEAYVKKVADLNNMSEEAAFKKLEELKYDDSTTSFSGSVGFSQNFKLPTDETVDFAEAFRQHDISFADHIAKVEEFGMEPVSGKYELTGLENFISASTSNKVDFEAGMDAYRAYWGDNGSQYNQKVLKRRQEKPGDFFTLNSLAKSINSVANLKVGFGAAIQDLKTPFRMAETHGIVPYLISVARRFQPGNKDYATLRKMADNVDLLGIRNNYAREGEAGIARKGMDTYFNIIGASKSQRFAARQNLYASHEKMKSLVKELQNSARKGVEPSPRVTNLLKNQFGIIDEKIANPLNIDRIDFTIGPVYNTAANIQGQLGGNLTWAHNHGAMGSAIYKFSRYVMITHNQFKDIIKSSAKGVAAEVKKGSVVGVGRELVKGDLLSVPIYLGAANWAQDTFFTYLEEKGGEIGAVAEFVDSKIYDKDDPLADKKSIAAMSMDAVKDEYASQVGIFSILDKLMGNEYTRSGADYLAGLSGSLGIAADTGFDVTTQIVDDINKGEFSWKEYTKQIGLGRDAMKIFGALFDDDGAKEDSIEMLKNIEKNGDGGLEERVYTYYERLKDKSFSMTDKEKVKKGDPFLDFMREMKNKYPDKYKALIKRNVAQLGVEFGISSEELQKGMDSENYTKSQKKSVYKLVHKIKAKESGKSFEKYAYDLAKESGNALKASLQMKRDGIIGEKEVKYILEQEK